MKPFSVNRDSWHYKLNKNFFNSDNMTYTWEPKRSNFCSYWRATMFRLSFAGLLSIFGIGLLSMMGVGAYNEPMTALAVVGSIFGMILTIVGIAATVSFFSNRKKAKSDKPDSLFVQKYKAHKAKICPSVEFK